MAREVRLHDTLSGSLKPLEPRDPGKVGIYACGPTVYGRIHVGNARPYIVFSLFKRFLEHEGYDVTFVANVTDVNDKIYDAASAQGVPSEQLAAEMTAAYEEDTNGLELGRPDAEPKASETIDAIVALIQDLVDSGHAYPSGGDVYFRVGSFADYGKLSNREIDDMRQGEDEADERLKESPQDFALWKAHKEGEDTDWPSPWGRGRPGWHIECSAMAEEILGVDFDVHGGGSDLIFPHHENEIAQTEAARGKPLARIWMHNGMVQLDAEKMSKSIGNIRSLHGALEARGRDALIMYFVGGHYRGPLAFSEEALEEASRAVERVRDLINTAEARSVLFEWVSEANRRIDAGEAVGPGRLPEMLYALGLENLLSEEEESPPPEAQQLLREREEARAARDFATADAKRDELAALGWEVRDTPEGPRLVRRR
jgi:cysteinyl-tRNA synthetase